MARGRGAFIALLGLFALAVAPATTSAQILNTLRGWEAAEPGWAGGAEVSFSATGGNTEVLNLAAAARVQWVRGRERVRLLGGVSRSESGDEKIAESAVGHLRHNHRFLPWLSSLVFTQIQENPFQRLQSRFLLGAGARFDLVRRDELGLSLGASHMLEIERIDGVPGREEEHRLSSFISLRGELNEMVEVDVSGFYQPRWDDFEDARASAQASLAVRVVGELRLMQAGSFSYDSRPPEDVEKEDWSLQTGLTYEL